MAQPLESLLPPTQQEIAQLAYQIWQDKGCPVTFDPQANWTNAELTLWHEFADSVDLTEGLEE
jgi:hypothetical protein